MADIIQWNVRGFRANLKELRLLCDQYNPQVVVVLECQLRKDKIINLTVFFWYSKKVHMETVLQEVLPYTLINPFCSVKLNLTLISRLSRSECQPRKPELFVIFFHQHWTVFFVFGFFFVFFPSDLEHLVEQIPAPFVLVGYFNAHSCL